MPLKESFPFFTLSSAMTPLKSGRIIRAAMTEEYLRTIAAHFRALLVMQIAHELFGKSLFELTPDQDKECHNCALSMVRFCYQGMTPDAIRKMDEVEPPAKSH